MKLFNTCLLLLLGLFTSSLKADEFSEQADLKAKIVELASAYTGQVLKRTKLAP